MNEQTMPAGLVDFRLDLLALVVQHVAYDDAGAFFGEELGLGCSHAPGASAYECHFAFQSHFVPPCVRLITRWLMIERRLGLRKLSVPVRILLKEQPLLDQVLRRLVDGLYVSLLGAVTLLQGRTLVS